MDILRISEVIKEKRKAMGYTQEQLADILYVTKAAVSKWENAESYPDITLLTKIAETFHITMDELFGYRLAIKPLLIKNRYPTTFYLSQIEDYSIFDCCHVSEMRLQKYGYDREDGSIDWKWEVVIGAMSDKENFLDTLRKCMKSGLIIDVCSQRIGEGKFINDDLPNKHYVSKERTWEFRAGDKKYIRQMFKEQLALGLVTEDDLF